MGFVVPTAFAYLLIIYRWQSVCRSCFKSERDRSGPKSLGCSVFPLKSPISFVRHMFANQSLLPRILISFWVAVPGGNGQTRPQETPERHIPPPKSRALRSVPLDNAGPRGQGVLDLETR